jgi:hypothetical protein
VLADVADFNNDGIPDIASVQGYPNALSVSLADKPGHFLSPTNLPITSNNDSTFIRVLAADLDADGLVDLIVTGETTTIPSSSVTIPRRPAPFLRQPSSSLAKELPSPSQTSITTACPT